MLMPAIHRHLPRSPMERRRDIASLRAEVTHLSALVLKLERAQEVQFQRIVQIQQQLDELTKLLKNLER